MQVSSLQTLSQSATAGSSVSSETQESSSSFSQDEDKRKTATPENWFDSDGEEEEEAEVEVPAEESEKDDYEVESERGEKQKEKEEVANDDHLVVLNGEDDDLAQVESGVAREKQVSAKIPQREQHLLDTLYQLRARVEYLENYVGEQDNRVRELEAWRNKVETSLREEIRNLIEQVWDKV